MKPEARFYHTMAKRMVKPLDRLDRIENSIGSGYPDTNMTLDSEDVWVELKAPTEPKRPTTPLMTSNGNHPLLDSQINWFCRQRQSGGIAFILVRTDRRIMLIDGTRWAKEFNSWTVETMVSRALFSCPVPTPLNKWRELRATIFTASRYHRLDRHQRAQQLLDELERKKLVCDPRALR